MIVILIAVGLVVLLAAQGVYYLAIYHGERNRSELRRRLQSLSKSAEAGGSLLREGRMARDPRIAALMRQLPFAEDLERLLLQTDLTWTVASILFVGALLATGLTGGLAFLTAGQLILALVGVPLGFGIPLLVVLNARSRRSAKLSEQLPDALDMMVRSLRAGHGITSAFSLVASEMPMPVAIEFGRAYEEQQAGANIRDAVKNMATRVGDNLDLRIFATSIIVQHETGGNLVEILDNLATTVRDRYKFYGKLRALTTEARMSGIILGALPFFCGLAIALLNPKYLKPMFTDPLGNVILLGGAVLWFFGGLWMRRLAQVDY